MKNDQKKWQALVAVWESPLPVSGLDVFAEFLKQNHPGSMFDDDTPSNAEEPQPTQ